jgi:aminoglycoside phosphotransferase (APT) family kinase protein
MLDQKFDQDPNPRIDQPVAVRSGEELDIAKLEPYLLKELPTATGPLRVEQFPGGMSNLTYLLRLGDRQLVLRRPPFGVAIKSAHDMGREYKILNQLAPVYSKAPKPLLYCQETDIIGAPFYLMERVQGRILRSSTAPQDVPASATMAKVADALVDALVELHALDYEAAGLGDLGRPEGYVDRQVSGWAKRYRAARTDDLPDLEKVAGWLQDSLPAEGDSTLIHNDFKYDNAVLDPQDASRILALLDWEMATLGDPMMDLGTTLAYWTDPGDPPELAALSLSPTLLPGNPTRRQVADRYSRQSGRELGDIVFYYAYGLFKIAVIIQQIYFRYQQGHTQDPRFACLIKGVEVCGRMAAQAIDKKRIDCLFK